VVRPLHLFLFPYFVHYLISRYGLTIYRMRPSTNMALSKWDEVGDIMIENDDIKIIAGVAPEYPFGLHYDFGSFPAYFIGRPKYTYGTNCYLNEQCDDANSYTTDTCSTNEWWVFRQRLFAQLYQRSFSYNNGLTQPPRSLSLCLQSKSSRFKRQCLRKRYLRASCW